MRKALLIILISFLNLFQLIAQTGKLKGRVYNVINNDPIPFATVVIDSLKLSATTDTNGFYQIENIPPGIHNLYCSFVGFKRLDFFEININAIKITTIDFPLSENSITLKDAQVTASPFNKTEESPLSLRTISSTEIYRSPGSSRDISKVLQNLPGVGSTVSFRNDLIVRGGAPNENRFYLDGIEIPNINHFATQGSSGGPVGLINVDFIREVDFYSGAFPANRGNALSSVLDFKFIEGNNEKLAGAATVGSSDIGLTLDGPIGKRSTFLFSVRRSYLQFLFKALGLPFLPTYNDLQFKQNVKINNKNSVSFLFLGAIDQFELNKTVNDKITDTEIIERNNYLLGNLPVNSQWNYTIGGIYKHFSSDYFYTLALSRNQLNNQAEKYLNNIETAENLLLEYNSQEIENKIRFEKTTLKNNWKINFGLGAENILYTNQTFQRIQNSGVLITDNYSSRLTFNKYSGFGQISKNIFEEKLAISLGIRSDGNNYSDEMINPLDQLSPRFSLSLKLTKDIFLNFNAGRYFQLPAYTVLGYRNSQNELVNKLNKVTFIQNDHLVAGIEYNPTRFSKITCETFFKKYKNYPFLLNDSISLANLGGDFGVIGNEAATSISDGRSYGIELFFQQKLNKFFYGIISYTFFKSEFQDKNGKYRPTSWDNGHILNITAGVKLKRNWEGGFKFRLLGGAPFTPYDLALSSKKEIWNIYNRGLNDWDKLNENRLALFHSLDVRIDKKWFFKKWTLNLYLDIQNIYNNTIEDIPFLNVKRDAAGNIEENPLDSTSYNAYLIKNTSGNILPSIGIRVEF